MESDTLQGGCICFQVVSYSLHRKRFLSFPLRTLETSFPKTVLPKIRILLESKLALQFSSPDISFLTLLLKSFLACPSDSDNDSLRFPRMHIYPGLDRLLPNFQMKESAAYLEAAAAAAALLNYSG